MKKFFILGVFFSIAVALYGQHSNVVFQQVVRYSVGKYALDLSYRDNKAALDALLRHLRSLEGKKAITQIELVGSASLEGNIKSNTVLSDFRAKGVRDWLQRHLHLPDSLWAVYAFGTQRGHLDALVRSSDMPDKAKVLDLISEMQMDSLEGHLRRLDNGMFWRYLERYIFPDMRAVVISCESEPLVASGEPSLPLLPAGDTADVFSGDEDLLARMEPLADTADMPSGAAELGADTLGLPVEQVQSPSGPDRKPFYMSLKTNLLFDAALVPNLGLEFYLGKDWSVSGNWMYAWWQVANQYWRIYGGEVAVRKWLRGRSQKPLTGHHLGLYGQMFTYDFQIGGRGYLGGAAGGSLLDLPNWAAGLEYGYAMPVGRRLNIDFAIGLGYWGGKYHEYRSTNGQDVWVSTRQRRWLGPTKAEISLVWLLGHGNYNEMW